MEILGIIMAIIVAGGTLAVFVSPVIIIIWYIRKNRKDKRKSKEYAEWKAEFERNRESKAMERLKIIEDLTVCKEKIIEVRIAGLYYRSKATQEIADELTIGSFLDLKRNPSNEYDQFAVKVLSGNTCIGFIPATYSETVSNEIKKGKGYRVYVSKKFQTGFVPDIYIKLFPCETTNKA